MRNVSVLMSTYNGEKYLREQIESVLLQSNIIVQLLVRDDGSTDATIDILTEYKNRGQLDFIIGKNIGWRNSFMELLYMAPESDYYAFCDQDDIWLPEKLSVAVEMLENENKRESPLLYGSNLYYYRNGEKDGMLNLNANFTKQSSLVRTLTCGCTLVFNHSLCQILKNNRPCYLEAHDSWVFMTAIYLGKVIYDPNSYILYRQHENNQIGAKKTFFEKISRRFDTIKKLGKEQSKRRTAEEFLRLYNDVLEEKDRACLSKFTNYNRGLIFKIRLLFDNRYSTGRILSDLFLKMKILTNTI